MIWSSPRPRILVVGYGDVARSGYVPAVLGLDLGIDGIVEPDDAARGLASMTAPVFTEIPDAGTLAGTTDACLAINLTPAPLHADTTRELITQGWNVLTEKPAAADGGQWRDLVQFARERSRRIVSAPFTGASPSVDALKDFLRRSRPGRAHLSVNLCRGGPLADGEIAESRLWFFSSRLAALDDLGHYGLAVLVDLWGKPDRIETQSRDRDLSLRVRRAGPTEPEPRTVQVLDLQVDLAWRSGDTARLTVAYDPQKEARYNISASVDDATPAWISIWDYTLPLQIQPEAPVPSPTHVRPPATMRYAHALESAWRLVDADPGGDLSHHQSRAADVLDVIDQVRHASTRP